MPEIKKIFLFLIVQEFVYHQSNTSLNSVSANSTKWSSILKESVDKLPINCLNVFDHFLGLALKGLIASYITRTQNITVFKRGLKLMYFPKNHPLLLQ